MNLVLTPRGDDSFSADDVPDLTGKTALVTGATTGVGLEVCNVLASKRARVLVLARHEDGPERALTHIRAYCAENGVHDPDLTFVACDLEDLETVRRVADELCARERTLDILVCDAGVGIDTFGTTPDGVDRHFAVTHLGHFLLINRLLPLLRRTAALAAPSPSPPSSSDPQQRDDSAPSAPRIICVTSTLHLAAPTSTTFMSYAELTAESYAAASPLALYARAKLATILFVKFGLAPRLDPPPRSPAPAPPSPGPRPASPTPNASAPAPPRAQPSPSEGEPAPANAPARPRTHRQPRGILALATDPGPVHPGQPAQLAHAYGPVLGTAARLAAAPLERAPAAAARSTLWAATARAVEREWARWQGAYVSAPGREGGEGALARDAELGARLWEMSEDLVRKRLGADALRPWTWSADEVKHGVAGS